MNGYEINVPALENSVENLTKYSNELNNKISDLKGILSTIESKWENASGRDIESIKTVLRDCIQKLETKIEPAIEQLAKTMAQLAQDTASAQSNSL